MLCEEKIKNVAKAHERRDFFRLINEAVNALYVMKYSFDG